MTNELGIPLPTCGRWSDCGIYGGGCCAEGRYGGRPSLGTCNADCELNPGRGRPREIALATPEPVQVQIRTRGDITRDLWRELHSRAIALAAVDLLEELDWLTKWSGRVPCGDCKQHWLELWDATPAELSSPIAYFGWTVGMHNAVNRKLGKPEVGVDEAIPLYREASVTG